LSRKQQVPEKSKPNVPAYIVTFSDMVTLLLTFFVMLLSLANVQDPELFNRSRNAFRQHINSLGLGMLWGSKMAPELGEFKKRYLIANPDKEPTVRTIEAREENIRRIFKKVSQTMETKHSQIVAKKNNFSVTNISFSPGDAILNEPAKKFLTQFATDLQQDAGSQEIKLYVLGLARDERTEKRQWILSAKRAQAVADFLQRLLPSPGGCWVTRDSPIFKQSQILIAVLRAND